MNVVFVGADLDALRSHVKHFISKLVNNVVKTALELHILNLACISIFFRCYQALLGEISGLHLCLSNCYHSNK